MTHIVSQVSVFYLLIVFWSENSEVMWLYTVQLKFYLKFVWIKGNVSEVCND